MTAAKSPHRPVMLAEVLAALAPVKGDIVIDGTFGAGGYSQGILAAADCRVFAIDRDPDAVAAGRRLAAAYDGRLTVLQGQFGDMDRLLAEQGVNAVDGIALDIGVSSMQLDQAERGFSFMHDGPLDMRMAQDGPSAADVVNGASEAELADIIYRYGEERRARVIARAVVAARATARIERTGALAAIIAKVVHGKPGLHPATRTFQALRIYVNDELGELRRGLIAAEQLLRPDGRLAVVSFHSLEDRMVKQFLQRRAGKNTGTSRHLPAAPTSQAPSFVLLAGGMQTASDSEIAANPRARSAKLRAAQRTPAAAFTPNEEAA